MADGAQNSFADITARLDEIISVVRSKDTSLERSLDLYDEAIELGSRAVELVDSFDMSPEETAQLDQAAEDATSSTGAMSAGPDDTDGTQEDSDMAANAAITGDGNTTDDSTASVVSSAATRDTSSQASTSTSTPIKTS